MADYFSQTVVQPFIPADAITPLELALLTHMYEHEAVDDAIYFFSSEGPSEMVWLDIAELRELLADEPIVPGGVAELIRDKLTDAGPDEAEIELDLSDLGDAGIFQAIVARCEQLDHITITSAWTCSKVRPDGFGGAVTVVTAGQILSSSTNEMEGRLLDKAYYGDLGCAPGHGKHPVLLLDEAEVRSMVADVQTAYAGTDAAAVTVDDDHIRHACLDLLPALDFEEELRGLEFSAALSAIRIARSASA